MLYTQTPIRTLKEFSEDLLRVRTIILCSDGIITTSDVYGAFIEGGYGDRTVKELKQVLEEISEENMV